MFVIKFFLNTLRHGEYKQSVIHLILAMKSWSTGRGRPRIANQKSHSGFFFFFTHSRDFNKIKQSLDVITYSKINLYSCWSKTK